MPPTNDQPSSVPQRRKFTRIAASIAVATLFACGDSARVADSTAAPPSVNSANPNDPQTDSLFSVADMARIEGSDAAPVWFVIVSDFQCPYCKQFHDDTYPTLKKEFVDNGRVRVAYVNLPLSIHPHAWPTAERALCAGLQGKFWEYHDALFDAQEQWAKLPIDAPLFDTLYTRAGLDAARMASCLRSTQMRTMIAADSQRSAQAGASATPTFLISSPAGTQVLEGLQPYDVIKRFLDRALAARGTAGGIE